MAGRALHYVFKIGNRKASYEFYTNVLKMKVLRHEEFTEGCKASCNGPYNGRWSKTMIGYGDEDNNFVLELTYNYEIGSYALGNDYFGIYIESDKVFSHIAANVQHEVRSCGKLMVKDPDGHLFMVDKGDKDKIVRCSVNVENLERSVDYWSNILKMPLVKENKNKKTAYFSYGSDQAIWELRQLESGKIDRGTAFGRIAFAYPGEKLSELQATVKSHNHPVMKELVTLETPGKADVQVVILTDPDNHEICFVGDAGFRDLSKVDPSADKLIMEQIAKDDSDQWFKDGKKSA